MFGVDNHVQIGTEREISNFAILNVWQQIIMSLIISDLMNIEQDKKGAREGAEKAVPVPA